MEQAEPFNQLSYYTLSHPDGKRFIHQHIVDAHMAQSANKDSKPIGILYALIGLYLAIERNYTGRQVQLAHMQLSNNKRSMPRIILPDERGDINIDDVIKATPGNLRDEMIMNWCASVWRSFENNRSTIISYCALHHI